MFRTLIEITYAVSFIACKYAIHLLLYCASQFLAE